jgi:hypothetical protein
MVREAGGARLLSIGVLSIASHCHEHWRAIAEQVAHRAGEFVAVHAGQADVQQRYVGEKLFRSGERLRAVVRDARIVPECLERQLEELCAVGVVVDDEYSALGRSSLRRLRLRAFARRRGARAVVA